MAATINGFSWTAFSEILCRKYVTSFLRKWNLSVCNVSSALDNQFSKRRNFVACSRVFA